MGASCMGQSASLTCGCLIPCSTRDSDSVLVPSERLQLRAYMFMLTNLVWRLDVQSSHFSMLLGLNRCQHTLHPNSCLRPDMCSYLMKAQMLSAHWVLASGIFCLLPTSALIKFWELHNVLLSHHGILSLQIFDLVYLKK